MAPRQPTRLSMPDRLVWPLNASQTETLDKEIQELYEQINDLTSLIRVLQDVVSGFEARPTPDVSEMGLLASFGMEYGEAWPVFQTSTNIGASSGTSLSLSNTISLPTTGTAPTAGTLTLVGGTLTVSTTAATATCLIFFQRKTSGGTIGFATTYTQVDGVSFTVSSDNALDTSTFVWWILETHVN